MTYILFTVFLLACFAAGATGALFPTGSWYEGLKKPGWTPPNWLFPVAWSTLYFLMAFAAARVAMMSGAGLALALWALQIALNTLWTPVFFGLRRLRAGMVILSLLWVSVVACTVALWQLDRIAGLMFVPYVAWASVAAALNLSVLRLNPEVVD